MYTLFSFTSVSSAQNVPIYKLGESVDLDARAPDVDVTQALPRPGHEAILARLEITPSYGSSPPSYIFSGKVISDNTGSGVERVALYVGPEGKAPRLAGMTNCDGDFKFRLWIRDDTRSPTLSIPSDFKGHLYVGGYPSQTYRTRLRLMSGYSVRYSLRDLAENLGVKIVVDPEWQSYTNDDSSEGG